MRALAVLGVDTGVGKTHVSSLLIAAIHKATRTRVVPFKPLESGVDDHNGIPQDAQRLQHAAQSEIALNLICPWQLPRPISPAEELERLGIEVSLEDIQRAATTLCSQANTANLIFEGAGGVLSPLTWSCNGLDVARALDAPIWLVAQDKLGAMSQVLCAVEAVKHRDLTLKGVILNRFPNEESVEVGANAKALRRLGVPQIWQATETSLDTSVVAESSVWFQGA